MFEPITVTLAGIVIGAVIGWYAAKFHAKKTTSKLSELEFESSKLKERLERELQQLQALVSTGKPITLDVLFKYVEQLAEQITNGKKGKHTKVEPIYPDEIDAIIAITPGGAMVASRTKDSFSRP